MSGICFTSVPMASSCAFVSPGFGRMSPARRDSTRSMFARTGSGTACPDRRHASSAHVRSCAGVMPRSGFTSARMASRLRCGSSAKSAGLPSAWSATLLDSNGRALAATASRSRDENRNVLRRPFDAMRRSHCSIAARRTAHRVFSARDVEAALSRSASWVFTGASAAVKRANSSSGWPSITPAVPKFCNADSGDFCVPKKPAAARAAMPVRAARSAYVNSLKRRCCALARSVPGPSRSNPLRHAR